MSEIIISIKIEKDTNGFTKKVNEANTWHDIIHQYHNDIEYLGLHVEQMKTNTGWPKKDVVVFSATGTDRDVIWSGRWKLFNCPDEILTFILLKTNARINELSDIN